MHNKPLKLMMCDIGPYFMVSLICITIDILSNCLMNTSLFKNINSLKWRHNERDVLSNHRRRSNCLLKRLPRRRSQKTSKLRVNGLFEGNSPVTGEFLAQRASNAENVSIWWRYHVLCHLRWTIFRNMTISFTERNWLSKTLFIALELMFAFT